MSQGTQKTFQRGFTAVELLVTLFVAALFLAAGYQLFNLVITDSGNARAEAAASTVAYEYLRRYSDAGATPCVISVPLRSQPISIDGVANPNISIYVTCPESDTPSLSKVEAVVSYGTGSNTTVVRHATFVDRSKGATPNSDVIDGLIGWWKLNGNAISSAGSYNGTTINTTSATGQNGQSGSALQFNGSNATIQIPGETLPRPTDGFSFTVWVKPTSAPASQVIASTTNGGGWSINLNGPANGCVNGIIFSLYQDGAYKSSCSAGTNVQNTWIFIAGVFDSSTVKLYIDNKAPISTAAGVFTWGPDQRIPLCLGGEPNWTDCVDGSWFNGVMDDARYFNRPISASEVLQLYNGGPK